MKRIEGNLKSTGSELPRALLGYYYAFLSSMKKYSSSALAPVIIDSPNQQAQDEIRFDKMLNFIFDRSPLGGQVILATESTGEVELTDERIIKLDSRYALLQENSYDEVLSSLTPLMELSAERMKQEMDSAEDT